uniref:Uncharacterized protein n=1 Tax=Manihot esculenta TaxID=3983 RepID=A0A2C9VJB0_MANES
MGVGLEEGLNGSSVVVYGQLFVVLKPASVKLKLNDEAMKGNNSCIFLALLYKYFFKYMLHFFSEFPELYQRIGEYWSAEFRNIELIK